MFGVSRSLRLLFVTLLGAFSSLGLAETLPVQVDISAGQVKSQLCAECHGPDGKAIVPIWPKLAGQWPGYIIKQMWEFKAGDKGTRNNAVMLGMVNSLSNEDIVNIAAYYATLSPTIGMATNDETLVRGENLYRGGDRVKGIPACTACHGPEGEGNALANFPRLSGQNAPYVVQQLKDFRDGDRSNDANHIMRDIAARMNSQDMIAVANYISGLH
jgi:cytochrome c553